MEYISRTHFLYPGYSHAQPGQGQGVSSASPVYRPHGLDTDTVQFSGRNRAQESARAKRDLLQKQREKQQTSISEIEKGMTSLYDQGLHLEDKKAFQIEVMTLLAAHPDLSMDISLQPDLQFKNKRPAIPLLHFALSKKYFGVVEYMLRRDSNIDFTRKDFRGYTAAQTAQLVSDKAQSEEPEDVQDRLECAEYAQWLITKTYNYEAQHPEKCTNTIKGDGTPATASSAIQLKGFSQKDLNKFIATNGADDINSDNINSYDDEDADRHKAGKLGTGKPGKSDVLPPEDPPKIKTKKQKEAERKLRREQNKKEKLDADIQLKKDEQETKLNALSEAAKKQQEKNIKQEAAEKANRKALELNARLNAMPEMQIPQDWFEEKPEDPDAGWERVKHHELPLPKTSLRKGKPGPPKGRHTDPQTKGSVASKTARQTSQVDTIAPSQRASTLPSKAFPQSAHIPLWKLPERLNANKPAPRTLPPEPIEEQQSSKANIEPEKTLESHVSGKEDNTQATSHSNFTAQAHYYASPTPLSFLDTGADGIEEFSLDAPDTHPIVKLPKVQKPFSPPLGPSRKNTRQSSTQSRTHSTSSGWLSNASTSSQLTKLTRDRDEKQRLLIEASAFHAKAQASSFQEKQTLFGQALWAFNQASQALTKAQQLQWEKDNAQQSATWWEDEARIWQSEAARNAWQLQQQAAEQANYIGQQEELKTLKEAFNLQRQELLKLQQQPKLGENLEAGIEMLEGLQGEIKQREVAAKVILNEPTPYSTNPDDYTPCKEGGFRIKKGFAQGSWVSHIPTK